MTSSIQLSSDLVAEDQSRKEVLAATDLAMIMVDLENERPATTVGNEKKIGSLGNAS